MSNKKLAILGVVAVVMLIWAVVQSQVSNKPKTVSQGPSYLIQGLDPALIDSIVLGTGENAVTLKRQNADFVVVNKDNYPAKAKQINDLISKCLEIETSQFVTDNPANFEDLGVTEEKARTVVKFLKQDSSLLTGVIIGKTKEVGEGTYVRLASDNKVYETPSAPWFGSGAMSFIEQQIVSVKRDDINSVTVSSPDGNYVLKTDPGSGGIVMQDIPAGKKLKGTDAQSVFTALTSLSFSDVKKNPGDLSFDKHYVCRLKDSTEYTINIAAKDNKTYITCSAKFTDERPATIRKDESDEELRAKEAKLLADDNAKEFTAKHQGWIYEIASYKAGSLTKQKSDLLEDEVKSKEKEQTTDPNNIGTN
jgi:hypothetical protein